jgi:hypothetical protein
VLRALVSFEQSKGDIHSARIYAEQLYQLSSEDPQAKALYNSLR